jgi:6-pyruvoyltetrahydropterin/6-carboxytetrahydropterin synthase
MFEVTREISFCYGHRLLKYEGKCKHLHGHNGVAEITLAGDRLDERGMIMDFSEIKTVMLKWIDDNFDHRLLLHKDDPLVNVLVAQGELVQIVDDNPTAECIAKWIFDFAKSQKFPVLQVKLWETPNCFAVYREQA